MITVNYFVVLLECWELYYTLIILNLIYIYMFFSRSDEGLKLRTLL